MINSPKSKKLCFIIPEYDLKTPTHFNYLYDLIESASEDLDIFLVAEKGSGRPNFLKNGKVYIQKFSFLPLRILENILVIKYARLSGYRDFYVHYSFLSAFNASLAVKFIGGRVFYWNCGLPWLYKRGLIRETFELLTYKLITYLVTGTESLKKEYASHYNLPLDKIKVLPNWINLGKAQGVRRKVKGEELKKKLNIQPDQKVLLFAHRLSKRKGAHLLPEIAKKLNSVIPNSSFIILIIGDGPEREALQKSIVKGQLSNVKLLGWIPQNEILQYFAIADIFIMPSEEEGFPHALLESMAMAVPFMAFDVGGVRDMVPSDLHPYLALSGNTDLFAGNIQKMLKLSDSEINGIKTRLTDWVQRYDINKVIQQFYALFSQQ